MPAVERRSLIELDGPWTLPNGQWDLVSLLDVMEHHSDPLTLLRNLSTLDPRYLVVKVPVASGPIAVPLIMGAINELKAFLKKRKDRSQGKEKKVQ